MHIEIAVELLPGEGDGTLVVLERRRPSYPFGAALCYFRFVGPGRRDRQAEFLLHVVDSGEELLPRDRVDDGRVFRVEDGAQRVPVWMAQLALRPREPDRVRVVEGVFRGGPDLVVDSVESR